MIKLFPEETIQLVIRRHWIVFAAPVIAFLFMLTVPLGIAIALSRSGYLRDSGVAPLIAFFAALYFLGVLLAALIIWMKYYLDTWIITDHRIIDVEQHGLFHREISEIAMERIQNVTIEIPGLLATFFKYGTIKIQTASESEFIIHEVPDCYRAKDLILKYSRTAREPQTTEPARPLMAG